MKFHCPSCRKKYRVEDSRIPAKGIRMRCKRCQTLLLLTPDSVVDIAPVDQAQTAADPNAADRADGPAAAIESIFDEGNPSKSTQEAPPAEDIDSAAGNRSAEERLLQQHLAQNDTDAAARMLLEMIKASIAENDFQQAETRRDKIYEVAPTALNEIVLANELIDRAKTRSIDPSHLDTFAAFYSRLKPEETSALYFALKTQRVNAHDVLYRQGEFVSHLYFIEEGRLKMVFNDPRSQKELYLKTLYPGDITNVEAFLSFTGNTVTLMAESDASLKYLEKNALADWETSFPDMETKLSEYLNKQENIRNMVKKAGLNIRAHRRIRTDLKVMIQMLSSDGLPSRAPFSVSLHDISLGGLCYEIRLDNKQEAAKLLGHRLSMQAEYPTHGAKKDFSRNGKIVGIRIQPFGASTVHIQFDKLLDKDVIVDISQHRPMGGTG